MTLHVIGAGLAGLSCALAASEAGMDVMIHESARQAGGRCRSWFDAPLGRKIDNGTHLVAGGNPAVFSYLRQIGALDTLLQLPEALPLQDAVSGTRWVTSPGRVLPAILGSLWRLGFDYQGSVESRLGSSRDFRRLWEPLTLAILNTSADIASASLFRAALAATLWRGRRSGRLYIARDSLTDSFVDPAVKTLNARGVELRLGRPLRRIDLRGGRVAELEFEDGSVTLGRHDLVVLATPWWMTTRLLPDITAPPDSPIVNAHFRVTAPPPELPDGEALGLLGATAQWLFRRGDVVSVTVSAASGLAEKPVDEIAQILWKDVAAALHLSGEPSATRVIKEQRATPLQTPETERLRPSRRQGENLLLAGDWTDTGLPCTLEGAVSSGFAAARDAATIARGVEEQMAELVLVTGATGFVGAAIVRAALARGMRVRVLARKGSDRRNLDGLAVEIAEGSLEEAQSLEAATAGCDVLMHAAADYRLWVRDPEAMMRANVEGTRALMRAALAAKVRRIVYTSSVATLGHREDDAPADEGTLSLFHQMIGTYKRSKFLAEAVVRSMAIEEGLPAVIVNPSTPVGPRDIKPTPTGRLIVEASSGRMPAYIDTGLNIVAVEDVAEGHMLALEKGAIGARYILGGDNLTLARILEIVSGIVGRPAPKVRLPRLPLYPLAVFSEAWGRVSGREPMLTFDALRMAKYRMWFSSEKAERELGYHHRPAEQALESAVRWFREAGYCK